MKPKVAIVGRPNVGKSTFFNKIIGRRVSITSDEPGVTRDRLYEDAEWCGYEFTLIDTGGLDKTSSDLFQTEIKAQVEIAIDTCDVIVFLVDGKTGLTANDEEVAKDLRKSKKDVILVVNKLDNFDTTEIFEFMTLGLGTPFPISCEQSKGLGDVLDQIVSFFPKSAIINDAEKPLKIAIVGRPNVGKSSLINRLLGEKRVVVSDIEGTTRDSVLIPFKYNKKEYHLIDTAGLRRKRGVENASVEGYSVLRTMDSISRADIVFILFDGSHEVSEQDVRIAGLVHEEGKPCVVLINKWDIKNQDMPTYQKKLEESLSFMRYFKSEYISALTGAKLGQIIPLAEEVYQNASRRITTGVLNEILGNAILSLEPPSHNGRRLKISYATQTSTNPPHFVLFTNDAALMHFSYLRYLENKFRIAFDFSGTPIKFTVKSKGEN